MEPKQKNLELFEPAWVSFTDDELLNMRICDLKLSFRGTELELRIREFHQELKNRGINFLPQCYLADEWFCPDKVPVIGIPFYLAHPRLKQLEQKMVLEVEGGTKDSCMRLLRHESGHAINYAYRLYRRKKWRELFGNFSDEYPDTYRPRPYSKRFVRHLENWYAQYHPDEDFAETFAVWLDPNSNWRQRYIGWRAMEKLEYVNQLMKTIAKKEALIKSGVKICDAKRLTQKLSTYYDRRKKALAEDMPSFYDSDLRRLFSDAVEGSNNESAANFLNKYQKAITKSVSQWTGERKFTINRLLHNLTERCKKLKLVMNTDETTAIMHVTAALTSMVMSYMFTGKLKRHP